ncbi:putative dehydrogenase [Yersinia similis]|uniref:NAD-dependent epimerase/dehydratase family protein n=1 Tax=Yersinia similis TaxID=367190 RepID=UPI0005DD9D1C|nr:NAD(P)-dependent oxidoreductase [Yersinia similis]CNF06915.1 putative dehydrogenase [Yersinia similis]
MTNILITGASGFIGGAFMRRFARNDGIRLCGIGRRSVEDFPTSVHYQSLDLARLATLDFTPDVVIHAAGRAGPWGTRCEYYRDNVVTTEQVIKFCQSRGNPRLIYLSTAAVYYRYCHQLALTEQSEIGPEFANDYALTKYQGEVLIDAYQGEKTILRPCAVFGPGDQLLFPPLLDAASHRRLPFLISEVPARGELMHIDVLCDYLLKAAITPELCPIYNLSNAEPIEINAFLIDVLSKLGLPAPKREIRVATAMLIAGIIEGTYRLLRIKSEPPITRFGVGVLGYSKTLDVSAATHDFGPPSSTLSQGLDAFICWYKEQR